MANPIDVEKIKAAVKATLQAGLAAQVAVINAETTDFDIEAPASANYHLAKKRVVPQYPAILIWATGVGITYHAQECRQAEYYIGIGFYHYGPDGTEENAAKYAERMARAIDQTILLTDQLGTSYVETTFVTAWAFNTAPAPSSGIIQNAVISCTVVEATEVPT